MLRSLASAALLASAFVCRAAAQDPAGEYIIVGGGVAGFVLAYRLSANPAINIRLLEAGPDPTGNFSVSTPALAATLAPGPYVWNYTVSPQEALGGLTPAVWQGHAYGGGSSVNYMQYCRGAPSVFDDWANVTGDDGWKWENFLPYFEKSTHLDLSNETYAPVVNTSVYGSGPLEISYTKQDDGLAPIFVQALTEYGIPERDMNSGFGIGTEFTTQTVQQSNATRDSSFVAFGNLLASRPNVQVQSGALVSKINFVGTTAVGVTYIDTNNNNCEETITANEVIVSSGAINTPKLLKLSGVGPAAELQSFGIPVVADIAAIGENLNDHHLSVVGFNLTENIKTESSNANATYLAEIEKEYVTEATGPLTEPLTMSSAWLRVPDDVLEAANATYQLGLPADRPHVQFQCSTGAPGKPILDANEGGCLVSLVAPEASGNVLLGGNSIYDNPVVNANYYGSDGDKACILWAYKEMRQLLSQAPLQSIVTNILIPPPNATTDEDIFPYIQSTAQDFYHVTGTVALGSVIGPDFRITGLQGIRVIDSSIIPVQPSCYTQSDTYAIAERAADVILNGVDLTVVVEVVEDLQYDIVDVVEEITVPP